MHIQKMLNVLIVIFLIMNIGLFFYTQQRNEVRYTLSEARRTQATDVLALNGVDIYAHLPDFYPRPKLLVTTSNTNHTTIEKELIGQFFNGQPEFQPSDGVDRYSDSHTQETETLSLKFRKNEQKGLIIYESSEPTYTITNYNNEIERLDTARDFVKDFTLSKGNYEMTDQRDGEDKNGLFSQFVFNERYDGEIIFSNETKVRIEESGITQATSIRYEPYGYTDEIYDIVPPDEAIYKFMLYVMDEELKEVRITSVEIGYLLGPDVLEAISVEIEPYYRIRIGSGQTYYINAYSNEILD